MRSTKGQRPGWPFIPFGRLFPPSQPHSLRQLPAPNESQAWAQSCRHANRPQDRSNLTLWSKPSRIRRDHLGRTRRPERKEPPSQTQTASQTTRLGSQNENGMVATPDHMRGRSSAANNPSISARTKNSHVRHTQRLPGIAKILWQRSM